MNLKLISIILSALAVIGCAPSVTNMNSVNLQTLLTTTINSPYAKREYITGIPLVFQCNGFNKNQPVILSAGKMSLESNAPNLSIDAIYQIGSSSKSFTAVVALQLADEINPLTNKKYFGDKSLDSTVGEILGNPKSSSSWNIAWNDIPLRQLLNMTSGIPDCVDEAAPIYSKNPNHYFSTDSLLQFVANKKSNFEHGQGWQYSNTNYVIMNKIISYVTNSSIKEQITKRIINKLGMDHTYYVENLPKDAITRSSQKSLLVSGYFGNKKFGKINYNTDLSSNSLSITNAAGSIISNVIDMNKYIHALFNKENGLLSPTQLNQLTHMVATENTNKYKAGQYIPTIDKPAKNKYYGLGYGLGIMEYFIKLSNESSITMYEHGGDTLAFDSNWMYSPQKQVYAVYAFNSQAPNRKVRPMIESKIYEKIDKDCLTDFIFKNN